MSWQEDLQKLDDELSSGNIGIEEHRRRREELLASASSSAASPGGTGQAAGQQTPAAQASAGEQVAGEKSTDPTDTSTELSDQPVEQSPPVAGPTAESPAAEDAPTQHVAATSAAPDPAAEPTTGQAPPESAAERTQWVTQHPGANQPSSAAQPPPWQQQPQPVPTFPPNPQQPSPQQWQPYAVPGAGDQVPQQGYPQGFQQGPPRSPLPPSTQLPGLQQPGQGPAGQRPGNAGEAWQPSWNREWEPAPGGRPFDAFDTAPPPSDPHRFAAEEQKPKGSSKKIVGMVLAGVLVLALIGTGVWYFLLRDDGGQNVAGDRGGSKAIPADIDGMLATLPKLPGAANNEMGPTIPTETGAEQGLYPQATADELVAQGTENIVYKASVDGTRQYGVLAVPSERPEQISRAIVDEQTANGWQQARQPGTPEGGTGLTLSKGGITFHRVLYNTGRWTIFIGVSPDNAGDDAAVSEEFGSVVQSVTEALPAS